MGATLFDPIEEADTARSFEGDFEPDAIGIIQVQRFRYDVVARAIREAASLGAREHTGQRLFG